MKEIIRLIKKYQFSLFFILLEIICFSLVIRENSYQRAIFSQHATTFFGYVATLTSGVEEYFHLRATNKTLAEENTALKNKLATYHVPGDTLPPPVHDSCTIYDYHQAKIINGTYNLTKNYLTLNRGKKDGIEKEMAVCSPEGVVGLIQDMSDHFSVVIPLINTQSIISAKIKNNNYYGPLQWDGDDYRYSYLNDIPYHVEVHAGDTIVTSNYSSIFPEGIPIGVVEEVSQANANFLKIKVRLAVDFRRLTYVYVIQNKTRSEQQQLEALNYHE